MGSKSSSIDKRNTSPLSEKGPVFLSLVFLATFLFWLVPTLTNPGLQHSDEFLTYARTKNLLRSGDFFTLTVEGLPSWEKPPLQYWGGALLMLWGLDEILALRLLPLLFGVSTLVLTALVAAHLAGSRRRWAAFYSVILLTTSQLFVSQSRMAMLETGLMFFVLLAVYALWRAPSDGRWWYVWGLACGLGALQKAPMAWVASGVFMLPFLLTREQKFYQSLRERSFKGGLGLGLALTTFWPMLQVCRWGGRYWERVQYETLKRVTHGIDAAAEQGMGLYVERLLFYTVDASLLWVLAFGAVSSLAYRGKLRGQREEQGVLLFWSLLTVGILVSAGPIYPRYQMVVIPFAVAFTASCLSRFHPLHILLLLMVCWSYQAPRLAEIPYRRHDEAKPELRYIAIQFGRLLVREETGVIYIEVSDSPVHPFLRHESRTMKVSSLDRLEPGDRYTILTQNHLVERVEKRFENMRTLLRYEAFSVLSVNPGAVWGEIKLSPDG